MKPFKGWKYRAIKSKAYFEKGYGLTHYVKYLIAFFGLSSNQIGLTMALGFLYVPVCFVLGWWWFNHGWVFLETEVSNEFNWFVKEMRSHVKKRNL